MSDFSLPSDLLDFLRAGEQLDYDYSKCEPGKVALKDPSALELGVVWLHSGGSAFREDDPNAGEEGYYEIPAVSLTGKCEAYDPEFILLWLPNETRTHFSSCQRQPRPIHSSGIVPERT